MIIAAFKLTLILMLALLPTWILILRNKPAKAMAGVIINILALLMGPVGWGCMLVYALLASCVPIH